MFIIANHRPKCNKKSCQTCKIFGEYGVTMLKNYPPNSKAPRPCKLPNSCSRIRGSTETCTTCDGSKFEKMMFRASEPKMCGFKNRLRKKKHVLRCWRCLQAKMQFEEFAEMVKHRSEPSCPWKQWPFFICLHQQLVFTKLLSSLSESRIKKPRAGKQGFASNTRNYNCSKAIADYSPLEPCGKCIWFYCSAASLITGAPLLEAFISISSRNSSFHWKTDSSHLLGYHVPHRANLQTCPSVQQRFSNHFFDASSNCFRLPAPQPE